jgi:hypothetical protein
MATSTIIQITASAFISPLGDFIISLNHNFNEFTGFSFAKNPEVLETATNESFFLKISNRNGLKRPNEITENKLERTLKLK